MHLGTPSSHIVFHFLLKKKHTPQDIDEDITLASPLEKDYKLPDGQTISVGSERYRCPEALFKTHLIGLEEAGVHEAVYNSITKCDVAVRKELYSNVVLSGGNTMYTGFARRLSNEVMNLAPNSMKVNVVAPPQRDYSAWVGGSVLASLASFATMWVCKAEYDETGPNVVHQMRRA